MSESQEPTPERSKFWIWFLVVVLLLLLLVPVISIGLAFKRTGWVPVPVGINGTHRTPIAGSQGGASSTSSISSTNQDDPFRAIRDGLKMIASGVKPSLKPKLEQVRIEPSDQKTASIEKASDEIHKVLLNRQEQFVTAVTPDSIRMVVIIPSKEWPSLSAALYQAASKAGFVYRGPSQTSSLENFDTLVAEIEISRGAVKR